MTDKREEEMLHEFCLVCVHKPLEIHEGLFRDSPKTLIGSGCYEGLEGNNYCTLAKKAVRKILKIVVADDQAVELLSDEEIMVARTNPSKYLRDDEEFGHPLASAEERAISSATASKMIKDGWFKGK